MFFVLPALKRKVIVDSDISNLSSPLFKKNVILKFSDKVTFENTLFVGKSINNLLPSLFSNWFLFSSEQHNYEISWTSVDYEIITIMKFLDLHKPSYKTTIVVSAINAWNNSQKVWKISLRHLSRNNNDSYFHLNNTIMKFLGLP